MSDPGNWRGFKPDTTPLPAQKSTQEQLDELDEQIATLDERRKELQHEVAKQEVIEDLAEEQLDEEAYKKVHKHCRTEEDVEEARHEGDEDYFEAWRYLEEFGGHTAGCLAGALTGTQKLHPLCTCGWNDVATQIERG